MKRLSSCILGTFLALMGKENIYGSSETPKTAVEEQGFVRRQKAMVRLLQNRNIPAFYSEKDRRVALNYEVPRRVQDVYEDFIKAGLDIHTTTGNQLALYIPSGTDFEQVVTNVKRSGMGNVSSDSKKRTVILDLEDMPIAKINEGLQVHIGTAYGIACVQTASSLCRYHMRIAR